MKKPRLAPRLLRIQRSGAGATIGAITNPIKAPPPDFVKRGHFCERRSSALWIEEVGCQPTARMRQGSERIAIGIEGFRSGQGGQPHADRTIGHR
jgi:hypothetical protein